MHIPLLYICNSQQGICSAQTSDEKYTGTVNLSRTNYLSVKVKEFILPRTIKI